LPVAVRCVRKIYGDSEYTRHYGRMGNQHCTTAGRGVNTALRQDGDSTWHYGRTRNQHGTTARRGNTVLQDGKSTWYYGRTGNNTAVRQEESQHGTTAGRGINTALRQDGESITNFSLPFTNAFGNVTNCFEISGLIINVVKDSVLLEYDALGRVVPDVSA